MADDDDDAQADKEPSKPQIDRWRLLGTSGLALGGVF